MKRKPIELLVGLFVLGGILALVLLAFRVDSSGVFNLDRNYKIYAHFENIGGLAVKAPVTIAGVSIGRVSDITINMENFNARVEMSIMENYTNIPIATSARILTAGLLGSQYIGLEQGGEEIYLKSGDEIEFTQSAFSFEDLVGGFLFSEPTGG